MLHPKLQGTTLDGSNTKENVALYLTHGQMVMDHEGWIRGPGCIHAPIPEATTQPIIVPHMGILHSNAAPYYTAAERLIAYWRRNDINGEAHFQNDYGPQITQALPVTRRADCNYKANSFMVDGVLHGAISFESADDGGSTLERTPWNLNQLESFASVLFLIKVCYPEHFWCTPCTNPFDKGIDYHSKFREWSSYTGKTCPGAARIRQMDHIRRDVQLRVAEFQKQCGGTC